MWWLLFLLGWVSPEHTDWDVIAHARADVDGDGVPERVLVREPRRGDGRSEIAVHFADGRVEASPVQGRFRVDFMQAYAVDDRPGDELLVHDILDYTLSVRAYRDGAWARVPTERPGLLRTSVGPGGHGFGVLTDGPHLVSYRSVEPFDVGWDYAFPPSPTYAVDAWEWRYADGVLVPLSLGRRCVSENDAGSFVPC